MFRTRFRPYECSALAFALINVPHSLSPLFLSCTNNYGLRSLVAAQSIKSIVRASHNQLFP